MNNNISFKDIFIKGAVIFNPVLVQLVGLCPVVAASTTLKSAVILSAVACAELIILCVVASAILKKIPRWVRMPLYLVIGLALICPVLWFIETKTLINLSLGMKIYIPLIAINSVTAVHCEQFAVKNSVKLAFYDAAAVSIGASAIFILAGAVREILGSSSIGGIALNLPITFKGMVLPFGCLVLLGFLAAGLKAFIARRYPEYIVESSPVVKAVEKKIIESEPQSESGEVTEVEIFDEFWIAEEANSAESEPQAEKKSETEIKLHTEEEIDELFRALGLDADVKGDEQ